MTNDTAIVQQHASSEMKEVRLSDKEVTNSESASSAYRQPAGYDDRAELALEPEAGQFRAIAHLNPPTEVRSAK